MNLFDFWSKKRDLSDSAKYKNQFFVSKWLNKMLFILNFENIFILHFYSEFHDLGYKKFVPRQISKILYRQNRFPFLFNSWISIKINNSIKLEINPTVLCYNFGEIMFLLL